MTTYSRKMQAIFHRAQLEAERFGSPFLETWHVLLAMVEVPGSVAYLTFTDFDVIVFVRKRLRQPLY